MAVGWRNRHGNDDFGKVMLAGTGVTLPLELPQQGVSLMMRKITTVSMAAKLQNMCVHTHSCVCERPWYQAQIKKIMLADNIHQIFHNSQVFCVYRVKLS